MIMKNPDRTASTLFFIVPDFYCISMSKSNDNFVQY